MAESKNNVVIHGFSGKFGDLIVFRQKAGKTIAAKPPREQTQEGSVAQQAVRDKFQRAVIYAKTAIAEPLKKEAYEEVARDGQSAYNVAIADFFNAPDIDEIDVSGYTGQPGQRIRIKVLEDFEVVGVSVTIHNNDGSLLEEGDAAQGVDNSEWIYTTSAVNANLAGDKITVIARDTPANLSTEVKTL
jgi:hypothetical protein